MKSSASPVLPKSLHFIERDWLSSNQLLCFDGVDASVIDTGYDKHRTMTVALIENALAARPGSRLARVVNTHLHADHCGANAALAARFGCTITVPMACYDAASRWDATRLTFDALAQACDRFPVEDALAPGDTLEAGGLCWRAIGAPGHDPTSLIFFAPSHGLLVSADALWANGFGLLFPELEGASGFVEQRAVLDAIEALDARVVIPGHGPIFTDVADAIVRAHRRLDGLETDPSRHARHALKVLVMFRLMNAERESLAQMNAALADARLMHEAAARGGMSLAEGLTWAVDELVRGGQLARDGDVVVRR